MKVADCKFFHSRWEELNKKIGHILSESHKEDGTINDWSDAISKAKSELDNLNAMAWSFKHSKSK